MTERQYIIGRRANGDANALEKCLADAKGNDQVKIVSGNANKIVIVKMNESTAEELRRKFKKDLSIEEDAPLQY